MKKLWAILAGLAAAILVLVVVEMISHFFYPSPINLDQKDPLQVQAYLKSLPALAYLLVVLGHFSGMLTAAFVSNMIVRENKTTNLVSLIFGGLVIMNLMMVHHPRWFVVADLSAVLLAYLMSKRFFKGM